MITQLTNNRYLSMLTKSVDNTAYRHKLLVNNVANVNTPGYKGGMLQTFKKHFERPRVRRVSALKLKIHVIFNSAV